MKKIRRCIAVFLSISLFAMEIFNLSITALASNDASLSVYKINSCNGLNQDIAYQYLNIGATEEDIVFPSNLTFYY